MLTQLLSVMLAAPSVSSNPAPYLAESPFVLAAQCRFADGSKAILVRPEKSNTRYVIIRRGNLDDDLSTITVDQQGQESMETNGGIEKHVAIERIDAILRKSRLYRLSRPGFDKFLHTRLAPRCQRSALF